MTYCLETRSGWVCFDARPEPDPPVDLEDRFKATGREPPPFDLAAEELEAGSPFEQEPLTLLLQQPQPRWEKTDASHFTQVYYQTELQIDATGTKLHEYEEAPLQPAKNLSAKVGESEPSVLTPEGMIERGWNDPAAPAVLMTCGFAVLPLMTVSAIGIGCGLVGGGVVKGASNVLTQIDKLKSNLNEFDHEMKETTKKILAIVDRIENRYSAPPQPFVDLLPIGPSKVEPLDVGSNGVLRMPDAASAQ